MSEIKSIREYQKEAIGDQIKKYLGSGWIFEKWYEKLILVAMGIFCMYSIYQWIF